MYVFIIQKIDRSDVKPGSMEELGYRDQRRPSVDPVNGTTYVEVGYL